jgi:molecular chaperone HscB
MQYFDFFELPVSFLVDETALRKQYYAKSKRFHPDFYSMEPEDKQAWALEQSTLNNQAFTTLSDPDRRMQYILQQKGLLGDEQKQAVMPPDFLMEMMDINEAIMDLQMDMDTQRWEKTLRQVQEIEDQLTQSIQPVLERYSDQENASVDLEAVKIFFLKKRYLLRIKENLFTFAPA